MHCRPGLNAGHGATHVALGGDLGDCSARKATIKLAFFGGPLVGGAIGHAIGKPDGDLIVYQRR